MAVYGLLFNPEEVGKQLASTIAALDVVYEEKETRSFARFQFTAFSMAVSVIAFSIFVLSLIGLLPILLDLMSMLGVSRTVTNLVRWPLLVLVVAFAVAGICRFAPDRDIPDGRQSLGGILLAAVLCIFDSFLFSFYVAEFAVYDRSYGSLGAIIVLLLWLYLKVFAILVGAAVNFELENNRKDLPMAVDGSRDWRPR